MLLFELAIALDMRSSDLVDLAEAAGLGSLQAGSDLDATQVATLRAHAGSRVPAGPAAPGGPVPAAPMASEPTGTSGSTGLPPIGPATWGAPPAADPTGPKAPAHWGPPPGVPAAGTAPSAAPPAPPVAPAPAPAPVSAGGADGPALWGAPPAVVDAEPAEPTTPVPAVPSGTGKGQIAAIAAAVLLAIGLFAYMAVNTGGDAPSRSAAEAASEPAAPAEEPRDEVAYCRGVDQVEAFLVPLGEMAKSTSTVTFTDLQALMAQHQASVAEGMDLIVANGPAGSAEDAAALADQFDVLFAAAQTSTSEAEFEAAVDSAGAPTDGGALTRQMPTWTAACS